MRCLVVYAHPHPGSFCRAIKDAVVKELKVRKHETVLRDLYAMEFQPVLRGDELMELTTKGTVADDVAREQEHIAGADVIIFIFPIWWAGLPAIVKGYLDRVFSKGFAYDITPEGNHGLLQGKKVAIINTTGAPESFTKLHGVDAASRRVMDAGMFGFCGCEVLLHKAFYGVPTSTLAQRKAMLKGIKSLFKAL